MGPRTPWNYSQGPLTLKVVLMRLHCSGPRSGWITAGSGFVSSSVSHALKLQSRRTPRSRDVLSCSVLPVQPCLSALMPCPYGWGWSRADIELLHQLCTGRAGRRTGGVFLVLFLFSVKTKKVFLTNSRSVSPVGGVKPWVSLSGIRASSRRRLQATLPAQLT